MTSSLREELPAVQAALESGYALPSHWYTDPLVFAAERTRIFRKNWLYFGHAHTVAEPGTYMARTVNGFPIVVTRAEDGELRAFLNVCRHRLHVVATGCGHASTLQCHYHAWTYDLTGRLTGVPRSAEMYAGDGIDFSKDDFGLIPVAVDTWGPLIFFNVDGEGPSLSEVSTELNGLAATRGVNFDTVPRWVDEQVVECNWKTLIDNVIECYHCPTVHPGFSRTFDTSAKAVVINTMGGGCSLGIPGREGGEADGLAYHAYFMPPTFFLSARADELYLLIVTEPVDVHRTIMRTEFILPEDFSEAQVQEVVDGAAVVNREDIAVASSVQRGHDVGGVPLGYLLPDSESPLRAFASYVYEALAETDGHDSERTPLPELVR